MVDTYSKSSYTACQDSCFCQTAPPLTEAPLGTAHPTLLLCYLSTNFSLLSARIYIVITRRYVRIWFHDVWSYVVVRCSIVSHSRLPPFEVLNQIRWLYSNLRSHRILVVYLPTYTYQHTAMTAATAEQGGGASPSNNNGQLAHLEPSELGTKE